MGESSQVRKVVSGYRWKAADEASGTPRAAGPLGLAEQGLSTGQDQDSVSSSDLAPLSV